MLLGCPAVSADLRRTVLRRFTDGADIGFRGPAGGLWGDLWRGKRVRVLSDNMGVAGCVSRGWSGDPRIMDLVRHLLFVTACQDCVLSVAFVPTAANGPADSLSRGDLARFRRLRPAARAEPDVVPAGLTDYLLDPDAGPAPLTGAHL